MFSTLVVIWGVRIEERGGGGGWRGCGYFLLELDEIGQLLKLGMMLFSLE